MRLTGLLLFGALLLPAGTARAEKTRTQETKKEKTDQAAKKGALKEKQDPSADLALQKENVKKLRTDAADDRKAGNRAGAWAANGDAHHAEKLIKKDKQLLEEGKRSK